MNNFINLEERSGFGTSFAKNLRRQGKIPVSVYSGNVHVLASMDQKQVENLVSRKEIQTYKASLAGKEYSVIIREVQYDPITLKVRHVDMLSLDNMKKKVRVKIPLTYINKDLSPGIKKGGILNALTNTLTIIVEAGAIPSCFVVDLQKYELDNSIHVKDIQNLPSDLKLIHFTVESTIATLVSPSKPKS
ncbi:MAG: 50S ribosomal protein L25 [Alphaproteobacteria bacterium]|nr:MAG: 50S ribosomal protein L25 [Alphaproteobacteria bacterium]